MSGIATPIIADPDVFCATSILTIAKLHNNGFSILFGRNDSSCLH